MTASLTFSDRDFLLTISLAQSGARGAGHPRSNVMTFAGRLSVVTAYLAMAFVGAIVLGMV
ncbi:hypothetical protein F8237_23585 [Bradyrhizobium betae]|uniref:Uncharacterized protein n=1 Tax=Bradyrhizobium betae TaxID=244734 RepID=A0A5P6PA28_9BRAD|nr:hypothetical protein F8237_23585 [Bradyrhizobium betae]